MDNVDWKKIRQKENEEKDKDKEDKEDNDDDDEEEEDNNFEDYTPSVISWKEKAPLYVEIISLMQPGNIGFIGLEYFSGHSVIFYVFCTMILGYQVMFE